MNTEDRECSDLEPADAGADRELKKLLANWQTPATPGSLLKRMDSSFEREIGRAGARARRPVYWTLGVAAAAGIGALIWLAARPDLPPANPNGREITAMPPDSGKREGQLKELSDALRNTANPAPPAYIPMPKTRQGSTRAAAAYLLTGVVRSEQGAPLPGAVVSIHESGPDYSDKYYLAPEWPAPVMSQSCDAQGRYTLVFEAPLHAFVTVRKSGFAANDEEIDIRGSEPVVRNHRLRPATASMEGYVYNDEGNPIPGAMLDVSVGTYVALITGSWISSIPAKSDASGYYRIAEVPEGGVSISAASLNHVIDYKHIDTRPGECSRVDFHLKKALLLSFLVKNDRGDSLAEPRGYCKGTDRERMISYVRHGLLKLGLQPRPGPFECTISAEGYRAKSVTAYQSQPLEVVLDELEPQVIRGRVVTEWGEPLPATAVQIAYLTAETDRDGRFSKTLRIAAQSVRVRIIRPGYVEYRETASLSSGPAVKELEICLKQSEGGLHGRVLDAEGRPMERFNIVFKNAGLIYVRDFEVEDGHFSVTDVPAGAYNLSIQSVPYGPLDFNTVRTLQVEGVEIRRGYMYGELLFILP